MALKDEVEARYSGQRLLNLTRPDDSDASTQDDALLQKAVDDIEEWIAIESGVVYDNANLRHRAVAIEGVIRILQVWTGQADRELFDQWRSGEAKSLGKVTGRDRMLPEATTETLKTVPPLEPKKPSFDRTVFDDIRPRPPRGGSADNDDFR